MERNMLYVHKWNSKTGSSVLALLPTNDCPIVFIICGQPLPAQPTQLRKRVETGETCGDGVQ